MTQHLSYTPFEEKLHASSHGLGALIALFAFGMMLNKVLPDAASLKLVAVIIYGLSMMAMLGLSSLYHFKYNSPHQKLYKLWDHIAIYLMIAGSYTPLAMLVLPRDFGIQVMIVAWSIAAAGTFFKVVAYKSGKSKKLSYISLASYLLMGWAAVLTVGDLIDALPSAGVIWLGIGGAFYSIGAIFYALKSYRYTHFVWHLFVLGGTISHFIAIYFYVL